MDKHSFWTRMASGLLALLLVLGMGLAPVEASAISSDKPSQKPEAPGNDWEANVLMEDPLGRLVSDKEKIRSVTFLDSTATAPRITWNVSSGFGRSVRGWIVWKDKKADVFIAADGGINGKEACCKLFLECYELEEVNFNGAFHTDQATSMYEMFRGCVDLTELDLSTLNTENVETMYAMFSVCSGLVKLDLSKFNTGKVTNMGCMFSGCEKLEEVDVTSFDTRNVTNMEAMFGWCGSLKYLDLSGWDFSKVERYNRFLNDGVTYNGKPWETLFR